MLKNQLLNRASSCPHIVLEFDFCQLVLRRLERVSVVVAVSFPQLDALVNTVFTHETNVESSVEQFELVMSSAARYYVSGVFHDQRNGKRFCSSQCCRHNGHSGWSRIQSTMQIQQKKWPQLAAAGFVIGDKQSMQALVLSGI